MKMKYREVFNWQRQVGIHLVSENRDEIIKGIKLFIKLSIN